MAAPQVIIKNIDRMKISDEVGVDTSLVTFSFDQPVTEYTVNVLGVSPFTGKVADSGKKSVNLLRGRRVNELSLQTVEEIKIFDFTPKNGVLYLASESVKSTSMKLVSDVVKNADILTVVGEIDWTELYREGENRINIYGKTVDGQWTEYAG
jgi:hypothetical protein